MRFTADLFGRPIVPGSGAVTTMESLDALVQGQPKIGDQRPPLLVQQDVAGLQVAMNDTLTMGKGHGLGDSGQQLGSLLRRQAPRLEQRCEVSSG
jgi:hypothetical protein